MGTYTGMTPRQAAIRDDVCRRARTLRDRVWLLAHRATYGTDDSADIQVVRAWLFQVHHEEMRMTTLRPVPVGDDE